MKYQYIVNRETGVVCSVHGPYKGSSSDLSILKWSEILQIYPKEVSFFTDRIYYEDSEALRRLYMGYRAPKLDYQYQFNYCFSKERQLIERYFSRLKDERNCFKLPWKHSLEKHQLTVSVLTQVTNIDLQFHPLNKL